MTEKSFLARMALASKARVDKARSAEPEEVLLDRALATDEPPPLTLSRFNLFAELKLRSPADGPLAEAHCDQNGRLKAYASGGAAAVSVLTEPEEFKGSLTHLKEAASVLNPLGVPVMRKDFITDPYQVLEARAAGASGILLIVSMLNDEETLTLIDSAQTCGLFVLLEGFTVQDLQQIKKLIATLPATSKQMILVGVNCRDLKTLKVDFARFKELAKHLSDQTMAVAESGIANIQNIAEVVQWGYQGALVGSALMTSGDPAETTAEFVAAGLKSAAFKGSGHVR